MMENQYVFDPVDIQNKQFSNKMRSYNPNEVDEFYNKLQLNIDEH